MGTEMRFVLTAAELSSVLEDTLVEIVREVVPQPGVNYEDRYKVGYVFYSESIRGLAQTSYIDGGRIVHSPLHCPFGVPGDVVRAGDYRFQILSVEERKNSDWVWEWVVRVRREKSCLHLGDSKC